MILSWSNTVFYQDLMAAMRAAIARAASRRGPRDETRLAAKIAVPTAPSRGFQRNCMSARPETIRARGAPRMMVSRAGPFVGTAMRLLLLS